MDALREIVAQRRKDVMEARRLFPPSGLKPHAAVRRHRSLRDRLLEPDKGAPRIIAEIKRASPSAGMIRPDLDPVDLARQYQRHGAAAISILTEPHRFLGSDEDVGKIRDTVDLPLLRKDFIVDEYQALETAAIGGDLLLLIAAVLDPNTLDELIDAAAGYGLETLVEVHDERELETALALRRKADMIGVNSRNLKTMKTDLETARRLAGLIPADCIAVAESGIRNAADIADLRRRGYRAFLIGENLLKQGCPGDNLRAMMGG